MKIIGIAFIGTLTAMMLEEQKREFSYLIILASSLIISYEILKQLGGVYDLIYSLTEEINIDKSVFMIAVKSCVIAYVSNFSANMLRDMGKSAIALKIEMFAKVTILVLAIPLFSAFLECITSLLDTIK